MAVKKSTAQSHSEAFVGNLTVSGRNALRTILLHETGAAQLKTALGIHKQQPMNEHARRTGLARAGRTIDLFRGVAAASPANLKEAT